MDNFDVVTLIVAHIYKPWAHWKERPRIASYAPVSRLFQRAVESITFQNVTFPDDADGQARFAAIFCSSEAHRRAAVRLVSVDVGLPCDARSPEEHGRNEKHFTSTLSSLFRQLHGWEIGRPDDDLPERFTVYVSCSVPGSHARDRRPTLNQDDVDRLPAVRYVRRLKISATNQCTPHATCLFQLAAHTPSLRELDVEYLDGEHDQPQLRLEQHSALARAIFSLRGKLPCLESLSMSRNGGDTPFNHSFQCQDLEEQGVDPVCDALRQFVEESGLKTLRLDEVLVSPDLFRRQGTRGGEGGEAVDTPALWPSLRVLDIRCGPVAPGGKWYSTGNPNDVEPYWPSRPSTPELQEDPDLYFIDPRIANAPNDEWPHHQWRRRLDPDTFDPLLLAMVAARMPMLRSGGLEICMDQAYHWAYFWFGDPKMPGGYVREWAVRLTNKSPWTPPAGLSMTVDVSEFVPPDYD
ncbi:hypothetical protein CPLU01_06323 [Colletotrichum plurivorum]|uniref:F-box domain-containing protein n=1 Tax=Colletotrichum plurivorum TaxID=2175906 RepID=A0A8H6KIJ6_9PEZI|nr:hypothetical protein CPLU01_06323 [Colletotrichum plurivorum]